MKKYLFYLVLFLAAAPGAAQQCRFSAPPTVVTEGAHRLLQFWEEDDSPVWSSGLMPDSTAYWEFARYVRARLDVSSPERYLPPPEKQPGRDGYNARLMRAAGYGKLAQVNCLEALLLGEQAARQPMGPEPTEFLAFVLRRPGPGAARLKIWFYTVDQPGIGRAGLLTDAASPDVAAGWRPYVNLHNHNFFFDREPAVAAVPWPSEADAQVMKGLQLSGVPFETTAVTNGFHTSHLRAGELRRFKGAGE